MARTLPLAQRVRGVHSYRDLDIYRLAVELRRAVVQITRTGPAQRDFDFVRQIRNSARGRARNIAGGFSRFVPSEFRHFLSYAKASIDGTINHIDDGHESGYFTDEERRRLLTLSKRTLGGIRALMRTSIPPARTARIERSCARADTAPALRGLVNVANLQNLKNPENPAPKT